MTVSATPYMFINDQMQNYAGLKARIGSGAKFDAVNTHIRNQMVMPGQLVIVPDESSRTLLPTEVEMVRLAQGIRHQTAEAAPDFLKNYDLLQNMLNYGSLGLGATTSSWAKHLDNIEKTLKEIEGLYQQFLKRGTAIARQEFITLRRVLFTRLDTQLKGVAGWGTSLDYQGSLKKMLGLSTKSYLHTGEIRGYAERVGKIAKASKWLKRGTPVGIALNISAARLEIKEACSTSDEEICKKAKYVESAKLAGGVIGSYYLGGLGASAATGICVVVFGIPSLGLGAIGCAIVGGVLAGYGGGALGEMAGAGLGELIYEWTP